MGWTVCALVSDALASCCTHATTPLDASRRARPGAALQPGGAARERLAQGPATAQGHAVRLAARHGPPRCRRAADARRVLRTAGDGQRTRASRWGAAAPAVPRGPRVGRGRGAGLFGGGARGPRTLHSPPLWAPAPLPF